MADKPKCPHGKFKYCPESKECYLWREFLVSQRIANDDQNAPANVMTTNKGDCAHAWTAVFLYDLNFKTMGVQQATESFRNQVVEGGNSFMMALAAASNEQKVLPGN